MQLDCFPEQNEAVRLSEFSAAFREFWANWEEISPEGIQSYGFRLLPGGRIDADQEIHISRFRLKGFLTDYRKFHLRGEPTNFLSVCSLLAKLTTDTEFRSVIAKCRKAWIKPNTAAIGWHNDIAPDEFIDAYFNDAIFHLRGSRKVRLDEIRSKLTDRVIAFEAYQIAWARLLQIRNVNWLIEPVLRGEPNLRVPG